MIAALYVQAPGVYGTFPDVDVWPEARDARRYGGPHPVVAHPPCGPWGFAARRWRRVAVGEDGGCFEAAIAAVTRWGGVIEHPAGSSAWDRYDLARPGGWGWTPARAPDGSPVTSAGGRHWACAVDQGHYGHLAPKRTWLYLVTRTWEESSPPALEWGPSGATGRVLTMPSVLDREATPVPFAELLLELVRGRVPRRPSHGMELASPVTGPRCGLPGCPNVVEQRRKGPRRIFCGEACRQRASRQRRAGGTIEGEAS